MCRIRVSATCENFGRECLTLARIVCVANQKGGVGKTTTAVNLAVGMAKAGNRTLLVDLDPQCHATTNLGIRPVPCHLWNTEPCWQDLICKTYTEHLFLLPGSRNLQDVQTLAERDDLGISRLPDQIGAWTPPFDYVWIDCPPSLGSLTESALAASAEVVMPIPCAYFAMEGISDMIHVIRQVMDRDDLRQPLEFGGIVLTMVDPTLELTTQVDEEVREFFGEIVFETVIPRDVAVAEANGQGQAVIDHAPRARGARAYIELCMEVLGR